MIQSPILDGPTLGSSLPEQVFKSANKFYGKLYFSGLAELHHSLGIESCMASDDFGTALDGLWLLQFPTFTCATELTQYVSMSGGGKF